MRILLIEDEEKLAHTIVKSLEKQGYAVDHLPDGDKGLRRALLYKDEYDLIILDLMLPGISGHDVCKHIRAVGINTPILILTAKNFVEDKVQLLESGADDYLSKPFSYEELSSRVKALLRRPQNFIPVRFKVGDIVMDTASEKVTYKGRDITLTAKEYALLELFLRHPNEVLPRETIVDKLWGFDFDSFSNVVDVHIKNLRKKLTTPGPKKERKQIIETVRGRGYRLNAEG